MADAITTRKEKAYPEEPSPIMEYPDFYSWKVSLAFLGAIFLLALTIGLLVVPLERMELNGRTITAICLFAITIVGTIRFPVIGSWIYDIAWLRAFVINNADLKLNIGVICEITRYSSEKPSIQSVAIAIARSRRGISFTALSEVENDLVDSYNERLRQMAGYHADRV